jgi:hypothetical protein
VVLDLLARIFPWLPCGLLASYSLAPSNRNVGVGLGVGCGVVWYDVVHRGVWAVSSYPLRLFHPISVTCGE